MKHITIAIGALAVGSLLPLSAQTTTDKTTDTTQNSDGSVTRTETKTTTFNPQVRTKVVKYFDTYKTEKHGMPSAWSAKIKVNEIPSNWRTTISPGMVISEKDRTYLVEAPPDLVNVLPEPESGVRYYVAGSNVVAVNSSYRVVDAIHIPSIKLTVD